MTTIKPRLFGIVAVLGVALGLAACTQSEVKMSPDFGQAVRQDLAAQIADPDARYLGTPSPGSNPARVGLAQKRYEKGQVIQPSTLTASSTTAGADNGAQPAGEKTGEGASNSTNN